VEANITYENELDTLELRFSPICDMSRVERPSATGLGEGRSRATRSCVGVGGGDGAGPQVSCVEASSRMVVCHFSN